MVSNATNHEPRSSIESEVQVAEKVENVPVKKEADEDEFPTDWRKITLIMVALYMSMFLVALVRYPLARLEFH